MYSSTDQNEADCEQSCNDSPLCEMYLKPDERTCELFTDVTGVTKYSTSGDGHVSSGKVKPYLPVTNLILINQVDAKVLQDNEPIRNTFTNLEVDINQMIDPNYRCRTQCIAQGFVYCSNDKFISYDGFHQDRTKNGKCCSEPICQSSEDFVCTTALQNAPIEFKYLTCPNEVQECGSQSRLLIPKIGTNGIQQKVSITSNTETNSFCTFWVKHPEDGTALDKTWIQFNYVKNAKITVFIGSNEFEFSDGDMMYDPIEGMGLYATKDVSVVVYIERYATLSTTSSGLTCQNWDLQVPQQHENYTPEQYPEELSSHNYCRNPGDANLKPWCYTTDPSVRWEYCDEDDDAPGNENGEVNFEAFVQIGQKDTKAQDYEGIYLSQNKTLFNIDSECNEQTIWKDEESKQIFYKFIENNCLYKSECIIDPEEGDLNLYYLFKEYCIDRIKYLKITSFEYILVVGCTEDYVTISSFNSKIHKEKIGIIVVVLDMISVAFMAFIFQKLLEINEEYLDIMDDARVQMKDFGVKINNVKLDKYTQDSRLQKMKIWLYFHSILKDYANEDNAMEVLDVTLSIYTQKSIQLVFRMQEIQIEINNIKNNIYAGIYTEEEYTLKSEELKELMSKLKKLSIKYKQITSKKELTEVKTQRIPKSQRLESIQYVFITFKNCETNSLALDLLQKEGSVTKIIKKMFCIKGNVELTTNKLMGCNLDVETLVEPDEIIWENLAYTGDQQTGRNIIMQIISIIFLIIIAISTMYITGVSLLMDKFAPDVNCPELPVTQNEAFLEEYHVINSNLKSSGLLGCYCKQNTNFLEFWILFSHNFKGTQVELKEAGDIPEEYPMDTKNYCLTWHFNQLFKQIVLVTVSTSAVIINAIIAEIFASLSEFQKKHTKIAEQSTSFRQIFLMEFTNMSLIYLFLSFDQWDTTTKLMAGSIASQETETDYTSKWYMRYGNQICIFLFTSAFISAASPIGVYSLFAFFRFRDRGFKKQLKLDPEDNDDDAPNSKIKIQSQLEMLYTGKEFEGEKAYSRMMSTLMVIQMYSSGMPIMYLIGFVFYTITYFVNKFMIIKFYKQSRTLTRTIPMASMGFMKYGLLLHMINACLMLTNSEIFSVMTADADSINLGESDSFQNQESGIKYILSRFELFHQQVYFFCLIGFFIVFIAGKSLYNAIIIIGQGILNILKFCSRKIIKCLIMLFHMVSSYLKKISKSKLKKIQPNDKNQEMKDVTNLDEEESIIDMKNANQLMEMIEDESLNSEQLRQERAQLEIDLREKRKRLLKKRSERLDYSENMLVELNTHNLSNFYERSKRELDEFRDLFHQNKKIGPELLDPNSTDQMSQVFHELCFLMRVSPQHVEEYQGMLEKRIEDIEDIIDRHFVLITSTLVQKFKDKIDKERQRRQKAGIQISLDQQFEEKQKEKEALQSHPDLQFDDPKFFNYVRKMKLLVEHEEELIKNDQERQDNRRGIQEICRMTGSITQSYFIFDSNNYKVGRKIYYGLAQDPNAVNDADFVEQLVNQNNQDDDEKSKSGALASTRKSKRSRSGSKYSKQKSSKSKKSEK